LGRCLLDALIRHVTDATLIEKINLRVISNNTRAIELYCGFGFQEEGRKAREFKYADGSYSDDVHMGLMIERRS